MISGTVTLDLSGLNAVKKNMNRIVRTAVRKNSKTVVNAFKGNLASHKRTGGAYKACGSKIRTYKGAVVLIVGAKSSFQMSLGTRVRGKHKGEAIIYRPSKILHILEKKYHPLGAAKTSTEAMVIAGISREVAAGFAALTA